MLAIATAIAALCALHSIPTHSACLPLDLFRGSLKAIFSYLSFSVVKIAGKWQKLAFFLYMADHRGMPQLKNTSIASHPEFKTHVQHIQISPTESLHIRALVDHMQYADPHGHAEALGIGPAVWPLFGLVWPSSIQLARKLKGRPVCPDEKILELGCGLGLASLVMHRRGAQVHASDCHPLAPHFLKENQMLNGLSDLPYVHAQWGQQASPGLLSQLGLTPVRQRYDLIIGSDLLYERSTPALLADLVSERAKQKAEVWVVDPDRGHRNKFTQEMARHGFRLMQQICLRDRPILTPSGDELPYKGRCLQYSRH